MFTELSVPGFASHRGSNGSHLDPGRRARALGEMRKDKCCRTRNAVGDCLETARREKAKGTSALAINGLWVPLPSNDRTNMGWQSRRRWQL